MHLIVMGVAGAGKSTLGRRLADVLDRPFLEGDAFHPAENLAKMAAGTPLTDADRAPWLDALIGAIRTVERDGGEAVVACSALRRAARDRFRRDIGPRRFVHLAIGAADARERLTGRTGHFMPAGLVASQLEALDDPMDEADVLRLDATRPPEGLVAQVLAAAR
jgi:gluconokinase